MRALDAVAAAEFTEHEEDDDWTHDTLDRVLDEAGALLAVSRSSAFTPRLEGVTPQASFHFKANKSRFTGRHLVLEAWMVWPHLRRKGITKSFLLNLAARFPDAVIECVLSSEMHAAIASTGRFSIIPNTGGATYRVKMD